MALLTEFDFIDTYLKSRAGKHPNVVLGIGDDCALVQVPHQHELAVSTDTMVAGVHFPLETAAADLGYKALAISLSDLAAMGAQPVWVMAALTLPHLEQRWVTAFCDGFFHLLDQFRMQLIGGDMTQGPLTITTQVFGYVPVGKALRRSGAVAGDLIYVTGSKNGDLSSGLGDAGLALQAIQGKLELTPAALEQVAQCLNRPQPRVAQGLALRDFAHSAIDISDGLVADLNHILVSSQVGATIWVDKVPLSVVLKQALPLAAAQALALSAGDDYELCFTVPANRQAELEHFFEQQRWGCFCIGVVEQQPGLRLQDHDGREFHIKAKGYEHFLK